MDAKSPLAAMSGRNTPGWTGRRRRALQKEPAAKTELLTHCSDRFIPNRGSTDFEVARYMVTPKGKRSNNAPDTPSKALYKKELAATLLKDINIVEKKSRILGFKKIAPAPPDPLQSLYAESAVCLPSAYRFIPQSADTILDSPGLVDDYYLNLLDWSVNNVVSIGLGNTAYLWNASNNSISQLLNVDEENGPIPSLSWAPDGRHIAVGLNNSVVQIWDSASCTRLRALKAHKDRVGALAWNGPILTTGGRDGAIFNNDVRIREHVVETCGGHHKEVCGLKWSLSGQQLASGGADNLLHIWDRAMASSNSGTHYLHRLDEHCAAVRALAWCPFQSNLLASGGGSADMCIKFWNTHTAACTDTLDTNSQVGALLWNGHEREILSSHNELTLWKYPSMEKIAELNGHTSRVLHLARSPDGFTVASVAGDETLRFWQVFGAPDTPKKTKSKEESGAFSKYLTHIR